MSEYILILAIYHHGMVAIPFPTQVACERAKVLAQDEFSSRNALGMKVGEPRAVCVPKSTP